MRQQLTFNGRALSDFGVWFDGSVSFGSPERDVELVEVVGRNGALSISNDRFRNIEITFPCAIRSNFITNYRNLMAFLNSSKGYCRLETTQEPNYYRLALFMNQTDPTGYKLNTHGRFDLVFQVMPQRFLKSGETTASVSSSSSSVSGNPVSVSNPSGLTALTGLSLDIEPVQSGEGDPSPTNIRPITGHTSATVTRTVDGSATDYTIDLNGTIYGGTLDVSTGVLTVNRKIITFDGTQAVGLANWRPFSGSSAWLYRIAITADMRQPVDPNINILCDKLKPIPYSELYGGIYANNIGIACTGGTVWGIAMRVPVEGLTTATQINAWLTENPVTVCYELATPTTVQLTPQQISLLTGTNVISTDMNSLTVTISNPAELENPTLFESKPIIRVYGNGTLNVNNQYITVANSPYTYIDIDCELMDCYYGSNNANQYVSFSTTDYVTLRSGTNYFSYSGFTQVQVTPRWFEI